VTSINLTTPKGINRTLVVPHHWVKFTIRIGKPEEQRLFPFVDSIDTIFFWDEAENQMEYDMVDGKDL
jgi:hypothetical protein